MPTTASGAQMVPVDKIYVGRNVRDGLDEAEVDRLAGSIALQGLIQPVAITAARAVALEQGYEWELVAGFTRYAAVCKLKHAEIAVAVREADSDDERQAAAIAAARAAENIARSQLNPHEEAVAVQAILDSGLSGDGVAQALGWSKARVTARIKLLELPERAQQMIGDGTLALAAIDPLRAIGAVSSDILDVVVNHLHGGGWGAERFGREPGYVLAEALRMSETFGAYLREISGREIETLKLGKRASAQYEEIVALDKKLTGYGYNQPRVPFTDEDVDQARAAGVLIELPGSQPVLTDRGVLRELSKQAIKRHVQTLTDRVSEMAQERRSDRAERAAAPADPAREIHREHGRRMRQLAEQAHNVNTDLGWSLRNGLSVVDPADINVARFFVFALLQGDGDEGYGTYGDRARDLATRGIRMVVEDFRTDVTKTKKDGSRGALRIDYGAPTDSKATREWLWRYLNAATTAGELYGRALVVIAAEKYALRLVVPGSQQQPPIRWSSRKDQAEKALAKLAGAHLPATLKQLEKAIAKAKADHDRQLTALREDAATTASDDERDDGPVPGVEDLDAEDLIEDDEV